MRNAIFSFGFARVTEVGHMKVITIAIIGKRVMNVNLSMGYCKWIQKLAVHHFTFEI